MHKGVLLLLASALTVSGCLDPGPPAPTDSEEVIGPVTEGPAYDLPDTLRAQGMVPLGFEWTCLQPCPTYPFTLEGRTSVDVLLQWTIPANDVDLFVYDAAGRVVGESIEVPPQTSERITVTLDAGQYMISVEPWWSTPGDPFTVTADFAYP